MSGDLTEEQRERIEINRQRALQKKIQRQQRSYSVPNGSFDHNEVSSSSCAAASTIDYSEAPSSNYSSARESFGDSNIDWGEVIMVMEHQKQPNTARNQPKKRKLEESIHVESKIAPDENKYSSNGMNSNSAGSHTKPPVQSKSNLTVEQKMRMEQNRLRALERKKRAAAGNNQSMPSPASFCIAQSDRTAAELSDQSSALPSPYQTNQQIAEGQEASVMEMKQQSTMPTSSTVSTSALTEEQMMQIEQKRQLAMHRKQSLSNNCKQAIGQQWSTATSGKMQFNLNVSSSNNSALTDKQRALIEQNRLLALQKQSCTHTSEVSFSLQPEASTPVCTLSEEQRSLIEKKRLAALEKKQSRLNSSNPPSHAETVSSNTNRLLEATSVIAGNQTCAVTQVQAHRPNENTQKDHYRSPTDEQRALIEKKRLAALQKKQSREIPHDLNINKPHEETADENGQQEITDAAARNRSTTTSTEATSPNESSKKVSGLPKLPPDIQYDEARCRPVEDEYSDSLIENAELDEPLMNGWTLYEHQQEGVLKALRMRRLILAFDMGLGKTIIGCVWSKAFIKTYPDIKVFVISPVSLMEDWARTAKDATGLNTQCGKKKNSKKGKAKKKSSGDSDEEEITTEANMFIFSWSSVADCKSILVESPGQYIVICDEAHSMQSMESKRTSDALKLILGKKCQGVLLLSGTPMKNGKPSNLFPLLRAVRHPFGDDQKKYEFFFCNGQYKMMRGREMWDASGSSNLLELQAHTSSHLFRKTKDECMRNELHPKKREYMKVPVSSRQELRYNQALKELANAFNAMQAAKSEPGYDSNETNILEPFNKLRQASSLAKIDAAVGLAVDLLDSEGSVVIFTSFVEVAKQIRQNLEEQSYSGQLLTGEVAAHKRQNMVDDFQEGVTPVFVCTYGAGGVGLTLTAACTVILVDRPWTPGDVAQAEDRVRRIGQKRPVRSIWIQAFPIDEQIDALIDHKEVNSSAVVDGMACSRHNKSAPKISIAELVKIAIGTPSSPGKRT